MQFKIYEDIKDYDKALHENGNFSFFMCQNKLKKCISQNNDIIDWYRTGEESI